MTPTAWDFRNRLLAVLNGAKHSGKPYVDLESSNFYAELGGDPTSKSKMSICHDVMTRMMRPGDLVVLKESRNGDGSTILIRYILNAKRDH
jgi:hypothetical protein